MGNGFAAYPSRWEADVVLADGATVHVRPIKASDAEGIIALHSRLSAESVYLRFFSILPHLAPDMIERFVHVDYVQRMALVAELGDRLIGVARYDQLSPAGGDGREAEVAFVVDDAHQGRGVGTILLEHLAAVAKDNGVTRFVADTLPQNSRMLRMFHEAGFADERTYDEGVIRVTFPIGQTTASIGSIYDRERHAAARSVQRLLSPRSVAVIGAGRQPGGVGHQVLRNLIDGGFAGPVYPIHPTAHHVASVRAYPTVGDVPDEVDLAVIALPAESVAAAVDQCGAKGVGGLVILSSGFAERSPEGATAERRLVTSARLHGMRLIGPNCLGVINTNPAVSMNATFSPVPPINGPIGFISQSGGLGVVILNEMARRGLGVSTFVSVGNKADVSSNDLIQYWESDPNTTVVLLYLESFGNPRTFARVARRLSRQKPIVAVKSGRSGAGRRAAFMHTAALAATDSAVDALFLQSGVIRVDTLREMFDVAQVLATQPLPAGGRVAIVGNAGGPGVLAADACEAAGLEVPELTAAVQDHLRALLGDAHSVNNPIDLAATTTPPLFRQALEAALEDPGIDAAVAIFSAPMAPFADEVGAAIVAAAEQHPSKPVLACVLGRHVMIKRGSHAVPSFDFPESAALALARVSRYAEWRRRPKGNVRVFDDVDRGAARRLVDSAFPDSSAAAANGAASSDESRPDSPVEPAGRWLDPPSAAELLGRYRIAVTGAGRRAASRESHDLTVEVVLDALFGHLLTVGVEGSRSQLEFRSLPLTDLDARDLVAFCPPGMVAVGLEELLLRISNLVDDVPEVAELHLDPVTVSAEGVAVAAATVLLAPWRQRPERAVRRLR